MTDLSGHERNGRNLEGNSHGREEGIVSMAGKGNKSGRQWNDKGMKNGGGWKDAEGTTSLGKD